MTRRGPVAASTRFHIRPATPEDVAGLHHLIAASVRGLQREQDYSSSQIESALGQALGLDTQLIDDATYFVASPAQQPAVLAGCGGWSFRATLYGGDHGPQRSLDRLNPATDPAKIRAIYVHPDWARQGLGSLLLEHCERAARSAGFRSFEMGSTLTGVALYSQRGYSVQDSLEIALPNGDTLPVLRMTKPGV